MNFQLTTTVISKTEGHPYGLQKLSQNNQEFRLVCRICQLCLSRLWSDEPSPVDSGREGCMGKVICEEGEGVVLQGGNGRIVSMTAGGRRSRYRRSKCLPLGSGEPTQRAAPQHTHTHTHTHPGPCWLRENSDYSLRSYLLLKLYLKTGGGLVTKSCPTLVTPRIPGFSVHGILQARILEWVAISFSRGSSQPRD